MAAKNGGSVQEHVKAMTEVFDCLSVIGDPISEEDCVVHLLAVYQTHTTCWSLLNTAATGVGNLYYLNCLTDRQQANAADKQNQQTKEDIWHRHYGHLRVQNLRKLAKEDLVDGFDYNSLRDVNFCEPCLEGKHQRRKFPTNGGKWSGELLGLVHSDVCGKMNAKSLSGAEYFLTFIDDKSRYV